VILDLLPPDDDISKITPGETVPLEEKIISWVAEGVTA
jgi:hypothetical protein